MQMFQKLVNRHDKRNSLSRHISKVLHQRKNRENQKKIIKQQKLFQFYGENGGKGVKYYFKYYLLFFFLLH